MQNPAFWARVGLLWCVFVFAACWCASAPYAAPTAAGTAEATAATAGTARAGTAAPASRTHLGVANSQSPARTAVRASDEPQALPLLNGASLLLLAALLGFGALWVWRRRN